MKILQISDLHLNASSNPDDLKSKLELLHQDLQGLPKDEELVFCFLGDLIDQGTPENFAVAGQVIDFLLQLFQEHRVSVEFLPGNHDLCKNAGGSPTLEQYNAFIRKYVGYAYRPDASVQLREYQDAALVLTSSVSHGDHTFGSIDLSQLKSKIKDLEKPFLVLAHHALISADGGDSSSVRNGATLTEFMKSKYFIGFLHGHTHGYKNIKIENCQIIGVGPFFKNVPDVNNQLNLIDIQNGTIYAVDNYYYRADLRQYRPIRVFQLDRHTYADSSVHRVYQRILSDLRHLQYLYNLWINVKIPLETFEEEIHQHFEKHLGDAGDLLQTVPPDTMRYNHGQYLVTASGLTGVEYIVQHLTDSPNSARAILPLVDFEEVVATNSHHRHRDDLPSLNLIQFTRDRNDMSTLNITMYFRSLEVNHYLRINFCEAYLLAKEIAERLQSVQSVNLTVYAFIAQYYNGYKLGNKVSRIDMMSSESLTLYLAKQQYSLLAELFEEKRDLHTYADTNAIKNMAKALAAVGSATDLPPGLAEVFARLERQVDEYVVYKAARSIYTDLSRRELEVKGLMNELIDILYETGKETV